MRGQGFPGCFQVFEIGDQRRWSALGGVGDGFWATMRRSRCSSFRAARMSSANSSTNSNAQINSGPMVAGLIGSVAFSLAAVAAG